MILSHTSTGAGTPVVLIHGITEQSAVWAPLIPLLATNHRVVIVDLRGHGASPRGEQYEPISMATDIVETLAEINVDDPLLIGHSLGGIVATAYAAIGSCRGVINIDQPLKLADFKTQLSMLEPMLRGDKESFESAMSIVFDVLNGPLPDDEASRLRALRQPDQQVVLGIWGSIFESTPDELDATVDTLAASVTVPYLSLHGNDPGEHYEPWLTKRISTATVEIWPGLGHYPHLIRPQEFVARVNEMEAQS